MPKNYTLAEIKARRKQREAAVGWTELRQVNLGAIIDGNRYIRDVGTRVWVTEQGRSAYTVERGDANVSDVFGTLVWVGKAPSMNYDQLFTGTGTSSGGSGSSGTGGTIAHAAQHALRHRWRQAAIIGDSVDPVYLGQHQITDLLLLPSIPPSFTLRLLGGWAIVNSVRVKVSADTLVTLDDAQLPAAAGDALICRVELDDDGLVQLSYGSDYTEPVPDTTALGNAPAADPTRNTLGFVWMYNGQTAVQLNDILPTALAERIGGASAGGSGSSFNADSILTDDAGNILVDDNGNVLIGD